MAWTLTALAARAADALGGRRRWTNGAAQDRARALAQLGGGHNAFSRAYSRRMEAASAADRKALDAAFAAVGSDASVVERAVASGAPLDAVASLAARWAELPATTRSLVRDPLGRSGVGPVAWGAVRAVQVDQTTCGAAVMSMMSMITDPLVALWVATGTTTGTYVPREVLDVQVRALPTHTIDDRWRALQRSFHGRTTRGAIGPIPWPKALGTPPWRVDNLTRCAGLKFRGVLVDDDDSTELSLFFTHAAAALADGVPVPLYAAGDSSLGLDGVIPRHVVLLVGHSGGRFRVYEPGSGAVHALPVADVGRPHRKLAALGNWNRVAWMILPSPRG
jgi:hypothetical protein